MWNMCDAGILLQTRTDISRLGAKLLELDTLLATQIGGDDPEVLDALENETTQLNYYTNWVDKTVTEYQQQNKAGRVYE